jgi:hypothetical protein
MAGWARGVGEETELGPWPRLVACTQCAGRPNKNNFNAYLSHLYHWFAVTSQYGRSGCLHAA